MITPQEITVLINNCVEVAVKETALNVSKSLLSTVKADLIDFIVDVFFGDSLTVPEEAITEIISDFIDDEIFWIVFSFLAQNVPEPEASIIAYNFCGCLSREIQRRLGAFAKPFYNISESPQ